MEPGQPIECFFCHAWRLIAYMLVGQPCCDECYHENTRLDALAGESS